MMSGLMARTAPRTRDRKFLQRAAPVVLQQHVRLLDQRAEHGEGVRVLEVDGDGAFVRLTARNVTCARRP